MKKIYTAAKFGTFSSPTDSQIIYVDPSHADEKHHSPRLDEKEAAYAFERGLIEDPGKIAEEIHEDTDPDPDRDPNALGTVGAERTAEFAEADATTGAAASTLESRSSTAWPDRERVEGGADGFVAGVGLNGDATAQPRDHVSTAGAPEEAREEGAGGPEQEGGLGEQDGIDTDSGDDDAAPAPTARVAAPAPAPTTAPLSATAAAAAAAAKLAAKPAAAKPAAAKPAASKPAAAKPAAKPTAAPKPVKSENP